MPYCGTGGMESATVRLSTATSRYGDGQSRKGTSSSCVSFTNLQLGHQRGQYQDDRLPLTNVPLATVLGYVPVTELDST